MFCASLPWRAASELAQVCAQEFVRNAVEVPNRRPICKEPTETIEHRVCSVQGVAQRKGIPDPAGIGRTAGQTTPSWRLQVVPVTGTQKIFSNLPIGKGEQWNLYRIHHRDQAPNVDQAQNFHQEGQCVHCFLQLPYFSNLARPPLGKTYF